MPETAYRPTARVLHWTVAALVFVTIPVGALMTEPGWARAVQNAMYVFHKNAGVAILLLMLVRLAYRLTHPPAPLPEALPVWQRRAAGAAHGGLYLLLFVMAVSGYVRVAAGGYPLEGLDALGMPRLVPRSETLAAAAKSVHAIVRFPLVALIAAHLGAAAYHGLVRRDGVVARMWPGAR